MWVSVCFLICKWAWCPHYRIVVIFKELINLHKAPREVHGAPLGLRGWPQKLQSPAYIAGWLSVTCGQQEAPTKWERKMTKTLKYFSPISSPSPPSFITVPLTEDRSLWDAGGQLHSGAYTGVLSLPLQCAGSTSCIADHPYLDASPLFIGALTLPRSLHVVL